MGRLRKFIYMGTVVLALAVVGVLHAELFALMGWTKFQKKVAERDYDANHFSSALRWYSLLAEKGDGPSCFYLGRLYAKGLGCEKNLDQAILWYQRAADQGIPEAQLNLGLIYKKSNNPLASKYLGMAADQGNQSAQIDLGVMYKNGNGVTRDLQKALQLLRNAAAQSDPRALYYLGLTEEELGHTAESKKAFVQAYKQFELQAEAGDNGARFALAKMHYAGNGTDKDVVKAYFQGMLAARQGNQTAQQWIDTIGSEISEWDKSQIAKEVDSRTSRQSCLPGNLPPSGSLLKDSWTVMERSCSTPATI